MRGQYVTATVTGPDQWTDPILVEPGTTAAVSMSVFGFAGTLTLQRALDGQTWTDVQFWVDEGVEGSYDVDVAQLLRAGVKAGQFSLGVANIRIEK